ncbi:hypothetical protein DIPPA_26648 [Diplonema papillatum]|nr:hypothetical protein DIPPA_26648 [Diplonema papillatum]
MRRSCLIGSTQCLAVPPAGRHCVPGAQGDHQVSMSRQSSPYFAAGAAGGDGFPLTYPSIPSEHGESSEPPLRAAEELYHRQQSVPGQQFRSATAARSEASTPVAPGNTRLADLLDDQPNTGGASVSHMSPTASSAGLRSVQARRGIASSNWLATR